VVIRFLWAEVLALIFDNRMLTGDESQFCLRNHPPQILLPLSYIVTGDNKWINPYELEGTEFGRRYLTFMSKRDFQISASGRNSDSDTFLGFSWTSSSALSGKGCDIKQCTF
jgi:hypothetical protein